MCNNRVWLRLALCLGCLGLAVCADTWCDGVYPGKAGGHKGPVRVVVTVEGGRIVAVEVTSCRDPRSRKSVQHMPRRIVSQNSVDVDAVSGATFTSNAIKEAARQALLGAVR